LPTYNYSWFDNIISKARSLPSVDHQVVSDVQALQILTTFNAEEGEVISEITSPGNTLLCYAAKNESHRDYFIIFDTVSIRENLVPKDESRMELEPSHRDQEKLIIRHDALKFITNREWDCQDELITNVRINYKDKFERTSDGKGLKSIKSKIQMRNLIEIRAKKEENMSNMDGKISVFISYSHEDENYRKELESQLKILERSGLIDTWNDRKIIPGTNWRQGISNQINKADVILLLVSSDFINSDFCYDEELKRALKRHLEGDARVIPIKVRDCLTGHTLFKDIQGLPTDFKAINLWHDRDTAWANVARGIKLSIEDLVNERNNID
jgi:hypothetical protein